MGVPGEILVCSGSLLPVLLFFFNYDTNQTSLPLNAKFSAIYYPIELKIGMYAK